MRQLAIAGLMLLCCCSETANPLTGDGQDSRYDALEQRVGLLEDTLSRQQHELIELRFATRPGSAWLRLSDEGFSVIDSDVGKLTFDLQGIDAIGAGSRIRLRIGNPNNVDILRLNLRGNWGPVDDQGMPKFAEAKPFTAKLSSIVRKGSWNSAAFVIDGGKPDEIGYVEIEEAIAERISLNQ